MGTYFDFLYLRPFYLFCVKFDLRKISEAWKLAEISVSFGFDGCCGVKNGCNSLTKLKIGETSGTPTRVLSVAIKCCSKTSIGFYFGQIKF